MAEPPQVIELRIPSAFGYEKMAMKLAEALARQMGFSDERVEDLKTALSEACLNAIEHGNRCDANTPVVVRFSLGVDRLGIDVQDEGLGGPPPPDVPEPDIARKISGQERMRQMGLYIIRSLVDEAGFLPPESGMGNRFHMVLRLGEPGQTADTV
jgi:serine/threonine-protein kinase RsbW